MTVSLVAAVRQRPQRAFLNRRAVGEGIAVRHADLDDVRADSVERDDQFFGELLRFISGPFPGPEPASH